ncbi:putative sulfate exporter family transporter [Sandaracinus amylolyticus]|uniref:putative sulfate exporter family transporter n=1 Tax=Sandaracinus amylolyticus TaxID=927083 RepID=UPI001F3E3A32|nr:putative sulfate exporter family transporter [Sandaracinus amylolyticus]UJR82983.1 Hypothetical protein I5071_50480 [Sandaracinus amylolyticus]
MRTNDVVALARNVGRAWPAIMIALLALVTTPHAPWRAIGALTTALLVGAALRATRERLGSAPRADEDAGLRTLSTHVLRAAVVASALRLDGSLIASAGWRPWIVALVAVAFGLVLFALLARALGLSSRLAGLVAIGTSVCGAAAIVAAAPRLDAREEDVSLAVATVSVLGAALALLLAGAHAIGALDGPTFALVAGGGLHEVAHVVAASAAEPEVAPLALLTKLARVALLPVGLAMLPLVTPIAAPSARRRPAVPGLAIAFFAVGVLGTAISFALRGTGIDGAWEATRGVVLDAANAALAVSMAAIGLRISPAAMASLERRTIVLAVAGALALVALVFAVVWI